MGDRFRGFGVGLDSFPRWLVPREQVSGARSTSSGTARTAGVDGGRSGVGFVVVGRRRGLGARDADHACFQVQVEVGLAVGVAAAFVLQLLAWEEFTDDAHGVQDRRGSGLVAGPANDYRR